MANGNGLPKPINAPTGVPKQQLSGSTQGNRGHPAWQEFINYCAELEYGEIEKLRIQNGLPILAELTTKKVKFGL